MNAGVIIGVDPSLTATGVVGIDVRAGRVVYADAVETKPEHKKKRIRVGDDNVARVQSIGNGLLEAHRAVQAAGWVVELPHGGSRSSVSARSLGLVTGLIVGLSLAEGFPVDWVSPNDVKKVGGSRNASKAAVLEGTRRKLDWGTHLEGRTKTEREAIGDAAGAVLAAWDGILVGMARGPKQRSVRI